MTHPEPMMDTAQRGAVGVMGPFLGYLLSTLAEVEQWLRILSLCGGLVVCGLTIRAFLMKGKD